MSDLRSRISDVFFYQFGVKHEQSNLMADAVIRELGLKRVDGPLNGTPVHRYITDWTPNG
jgi:hypothetical protein